MFNMFNNGFLRHPQQKHNPCYRKVICYNFFKYIKENGWNSRENTFKYMLEQIKNNQFFLHKGLLEIYPTAMDNVGNEGCLAVEPYNGCFPLVLYPYSHTQFGNVANKPRASAFRTAARKVLKNYSKIFELLNKYTEWTSELESKLEKWFEYPAGTSAVNDSNFSSDMKKTG